MAFQPSPPTYTYVDHKEMSNWSNLKNSNLKSNSGQMATVISRRSDKSTAVPSMLKSAKGASKRLQYAPLENATLSDDPDHEPIPCSVPVYSGEFREDHARFLRTPAPNTFSLKLESDCRYKREARLHQAKLAERFRSMHPFSLLTDSELEDDPGGPEDESSSRHHRLTTPPPSYDPCYMYRYIEDCVANVPVELRKKVPGAKVVESSSTSCSEEDEKISALPESQKQSASSTRPDDGSVFSGESGYHSLVQNSHGGFGAAAAPPGSTNQKSSPYRTGNCGFGESSSRWRFGDTNELGDNEGGSNRSNRSQNGNTSDFGYSRGNFGWPTTATKQYGAELILPKQRKDSEPRSRISKQLAKAKLIQRLHDQDWENGVHGFASAAPSDAETMSCAKFGGFRQIREITADADQLSKFNGFTGQFVIQVDNLDKKVTEGRLIRWLCNDVHCPVKDLSVLKTEQRPTVSARIRLTNEDDCVAVMAAIESIADAGASSPDFNSGIGRTADLVAQRVTFR